MVSRSGKLELLDSLASHEYLLTHTNLKPFGKMMGNQMAQI